MAVRRRRRTVRTTEADWPLINFMWRGKFYALVSLSFGARSSPPKFGLVSKAICWSMKLHAFHNNINFVDVWLVAFAAAIAAGEWARLRALLTRPGVPVCQEEPKTMSPRLALEGLGLNL